MTGIIQGYPAAVWLFPVVEHSLPYPKQHALKLCLLEESDNPALLLPGSLNYTEFPASPLPPSKSVTKSYKVRKATCEHAAHAPVFKRRQNHTHSHRKLPTKFKIPKGKEAQGIYPRLC